MAPEQTGRMNRSVDARSDLYALGVTLYQMATGVLPFAAADAMELVHCHIARRPVPPAERAPSEASPLTAEGLGVVCVVGCGQAEGHGRGCDGERSSRWACVAGCRMLDWVYLNGYVPNLQVGGQVVSFMTEHLGCPVPSPAIMEKIGTAFRRSVARFAADEHIPVIRFGKKDRKIDVMRRHLAAQEATGRSGVAAIGVAQEFQNVFAVNQRQGGNGLPWFSFTKADRRVTCFYLPAPAGMSRQWVSPGFGGLGVEVRARLSSPPRS